MDSGYTFKGHSGLPRNTLDAIHIAFSSSRRSSTLLRLSFLGMASSMGDNLNVENYFDISRG